MFQGGITAAQAIAAITNQNSLTSSTFTSSEEVLEAGLGSASTSESQAASAAAYHRIHEGAAGASSLRDVVSKDTQTSNINVRLAYHCHIKLLQDENKNHVSLFSICDIFDLFSKKCKFRSYFRKNVNFKHFVNAMVD